jgi:hypothetical protein
MYNNKFYTIESKTKYIAWDLTTRYRFKSLFNSAKGEWRRSRINACADGDKHQSIVEKLIGNNK